MSLDKITIGAALVYYGNPTTASGAGMDFLGYTRGDIVVQTNVNISFGRVDQKGSTPLSEAVWTNGLSPVATIPFIEDDLDRLALQFTKASVGTGGGKKALLFPTGVQKVALSEIKTLCILPVTDIAEGTNGIDSEGAVWFPAGISDQFGNITFNIQDNSQDGLNPHEVRFAGLLREKDHDNSTALPNGARVMFRGSPEGAGISGWSLPSHSGKV